MKVKELQELYNGLNGRIVNLETAMLNHCGQHTWDRIINYAQMALLIIVILLLKFKIL